MALRLWLPLDGSVVNKGISNITPIQVDAPTFVSGKIGQALAAGTYKMSALDTASVLNNNAVSIAFWIYVSTTTGNRIFGNDSMGTGNNRKFSIYQYPTCNDLHLSWMNDVNNTTYLSGVWSGVFPSYKWTHCAVCYSGKESKAYIYINGSLYATRDGTSNSSSFAYETNLMSTAGTYRYLNDYRIYDHCLSAKEVKEISQGLVLHYKLDGWSGGGIKDNLVLNSKTFSGWSIGAGWVSGTADGFNTYKFTRTGSTSPGWDRIIPQLKINPNNYPNGVTVSMELLTPSKSAITDTCFMSLQIYKADNGRIGWCEPRNYSGTIVDNTWSRVYRHFTQNELKTISTSGYTVNDISYTNFSFQLVRDGNITIRKIKIEEGDQLTDWSTAAEDQGNSKTIVSDSSGFGNTGAISGTFIQDSSLKYTASLRSINGTDYIKSGLSYSDIKTFTCSFWVKPNSSSGRYCIIASNYNNPSSGFWIAINCESRSVWFYNGSYCSVTGALTNNTWYHCALVCDNKTMSWYINGVKQTLAQDTAKDKTINITNLSVFNSYQGTSWNTTNYGSISDFRFYTTALTADDILDLYHTSASVDNLQSIHIFGITEENVNSSVSKSGQASAKEVYESNSVIINNFSSFGYAPAANTQNSCVNGGNCSFVDYDDKDLALHIECNIEWTAFTAGTGGTYKGIWWQGSNYDKTTSTWVWQGVNYICSALNSKYSLQNPTLLSSPGKYHYDTTVVVPSSWFNTYNKSNIGFRCDYSDGTGRIDVKNFKVTPLQYYDAKIGKDFISADSFIEK